MYIFTKCGIYDVAVLTCIKSEPNDPKLYLYDNSDKPFVVLHNAYEEVLDSIKKIKIALKNRDSYVEI